MKRYRLIALVFLISVPLHAQIPDTVSVTGASEGKQATGINPVTTVPEDIIHSVQLLKSYLKEQETLFSEDKRLQSAVKNIIHYIENEPVDSSVRYLRDYRYSTLYEQRLIRQRQVTDTLVQAREMITRSVQTILPGSMHADTLLPPSDSLTTRTLPPPDDTYDSISVTAPGKRYIFDTTLIHRIVPDTVIVVDSVRLEVVDTLHRSIKILLDHMARDSSHVWLHNLSNDSIQVWMREGGRHFTRFWIWNTGRDSVIIWIENVGRNSFRIFLDDGVYIRKLSERETIDAVEFERTIDEKLRKMQKVVVDKPVWTFWGLGSIQFAQGYLSHWAKGGQSSSNALTTLSYYGNYAKGNTKWENNALIKLGVMKNGADPIRKNEDQFEINSSLGHRLINRWYLSILGNLKSQFFRGYNYPNDSVIVSNFLAPAYLVFALGMDFKPNRNFSLLLSPLTSKTTIVGDLEHVDPTRYGLGSGKRVKREMGGYLKTRFTQTVVEGISWENKFDLFTSYTNHPERIDVNWESLLRLKINFYTEANISTHLIYDHDVDVPVTRVVNGENIKTTGKRIQFKEILSVGFSYRF